MSASGSVTPKAWESSWRRFLPIVSARAAVSPESLLDWAERAPASFSATSAFFICSSVGASAGTRAGAGCSFDPQTGQGSPSRSVSARKPAWWA